MIVPTLREAENLRRLLPAVCGRLAEAARGGYEVVVVDDDSGDGTEAVVADVASRGWPVRLVVRKGERGLSSAVLRGFREATGEAFIVMDADLSHPPELLPAVVAALEEGMEVVLPTRYRRGGGAERWPLLRKLMSLAATLPARLLVPVSDPMSGYFAVRREVVEGVPLDPIGYKILLEILVKGRYDRRRIREIPYVFRNRFLGASKLDSKVSAEYVVQWFRLLRYILSGRRRSV